MASSLVTFARVIELLAAPRAQKGAAAGYTSGMVTAAEEEALTSPLTRLLWRAVAGSCVTTTLGFCSASEYDLPATIETCRTAASARTLVTAPTPNRTRPPPTLAAVAALLGSVQQELTTLDASAVLRGAADGSAGGEEVGAAVGSAYPQLVEQLEDVLATKGGAAAGGGAAEEVAVLKSVVRHLIDDLRRLAPAAAATRLGSAAIAAMA